ncbi:hypothetical protein J6590_014489 [Homalodisca vitripennis]|nr:hypothetical protein J6590_014489 [Homalodisca vitripennis]
MSTAVLTIKSFCNKYMLLVSHPNNVHEIPNAMNLLSIEQIYLFFSSKRLLETLAIGTLMFSVLAAVYHSYLLGAVAGLLLTLTANCAHNFFHMRDNWRMFLFNLSLFTVRLALVLNKLVLCCFL